MKTTQTFGALVLAATTAPGCCAGNSSQQNSTSYSDKDAYIANMQRHLDQWKARMGKMEAEARGAETRDKDKSVMQKLQQRSKLATCNFGELKAVGRL